jgi:hypothetical protein
MKERKYYWVQKNGNKIDVDLMDTNHLRNTLKMIIRNLEYAELKAKQITQTKPKFILRGEMANDFNDQWELARYEEEQGYYDFCN